MGTLSDILSGAGYALDTPGALLRGVLSGKPGSRVSGRELLENYGLSENQPGLDAGDVAGFAADLLVDPLNLIGGAGLVKLAKTLSKGRKAAQATQKLASVAPEASGALGAASMATSDLRAARKASLAEGAQWTGQHYQQKLAQSGGENVINPRSQLPLFEDPARGIRDIEDLVAKRVRTVEDPAALGAKAMYDSGLAMHKGQPIIRTFEDNGLQHIIRRGDRKFLIPPTTAAETANLASEGAHEGAHYLTDALNLNRKTAGHIDRTTEAANRMWQRRGFDGPPAIGDTAPLGMTADNPMAYFTHPDEVMGRVAQVRKGMQEANVSQLTPAGVRAPATKGSYLENIAEAKQLDPASSAALEELNNVYGPRLLSHLLRVLPAGALTAGGLSLALGGNQQG